MAESESVYNKNRQVLCQASEDMGGWESIAKALRARGLQLTRQHVLGWVNNIKSGVPPEFLVDMEEVTGIPREEFRQDIPWRDKAA